MSLTDQQLIRAFCDQNDTAAFGELVSRHQDRLINSLTRMLGSYEEACDVGQEAFLQAFRKLHSFRRESQFYTWLFRIAMNKAISRKRKKKHNPASLESVRDARGDDAIDHNPDAKPAANLEREERQALVQQALSSLSDEYRAIIVLQTIDGMSYEEIATVLECPVGTVRSRLHRARMELRDHLDRLMSDI